MMGQDQSEPPLRRGPRPLLLHLGLAMLRSAALPDAWLNSKPGSHDWNAIIDQVRAMLTGLTGSSHLPPCQDTDLRARFDASLRQNSTLIAGIAAYRRYPWRRDLPDPPIVWTEGGSRLLDYAPAGVDRPVILFVPSLVNGAHILDLSDGNSLMRYLADHGARPLLLDWGWPGSLERTFTLTDYVAGRLERALDAACALAGAPVVLAGYCMGGTLAVAAAHRQPQSLSGLALLATPWDFHAGAPHVGRQLAALLPLLEPMMALTAALPVDALQTLFTLLDPDGVAARYRAFAQMAPESAQARLFVALEDWLNDGVPLAAPVARECLAQWYGANQPACGVWRVAGLAVDPATLQLPCFVAAPARDRIVPPDSARALFDRIAGATWHQPKAGHIGMIAGRHAEAELWRPLLDWLRRL